MNNFKFLSMFKRLEEEQIIESGVKYDMDKAQETAYRFAHPEHYNYLLSRGMFVLWKPTHFLFRLEK